MRGLVGPTAKPKAAGLARVKKGLFLVASAAGAATVLIAIEPGFAIWPGF